MNLSAKKTCVIIGGGGHAKVLIDCLRTSEEVTVVGVLDNDQQKWGSELLGVPIVGGDDKIAGLFPSGITHFVVGVGSTGNNKNRMDLFNLAVKNHLLPFTIRHPAAIVSINITLGMGCQLLPGCILNAGSTVGNNVIINSGAIVEHDCVLEDHVHVATGARLSSTVRVGMGTHIGVGSTIRQCINIGEQAIVGAGAVVVSDVAPFSTVVGVPAKPLK